jgi:hypothetical protein
MRADVPDPRPKELVKSPRVNIGGLEVHIIFFLKVTVYGDY